MAAAKIRELKFRAMTNQEPAQDHHTAPSHQVRKYQKVANSKSILLTGALVLALVGWNLSPFIDNANGDFFFRCFTTYILIICISTLLPTGGKYCTFIALMNVNNALSDAIDEFFFNPCAITANDYISFLAGGVLAAYKVYGSKQRNNAGAC